MKCFLIIITLAAIVVLDQVSKIYVLTRIVDDLPGFHLLNLVHVWNKGISFGFFSGENSNFIFMGVTTVITLILVYLLSKAQERTMIIAYILIIGGALGNLIDRIKYGAVFDFIDLHIERFHWPAFNIADAFICLGGGALFWSIIFNKKTLKTT